MNQPFVIERVINAPIARVWNAITDKEKMKQWYFDIPAFNSSVGSEFSFIGTDPEGTQWVHLCKVTESIPNKKFCHTWRYEGHEGESKVCWELFEEEDKTRVKLTHSGLETFPPLKAFAKENFEAGWNYIVGTSLPEFLAKE